MKDKCNTILCVTDPSIVEQNDEELDSKIISYCKSIYGEKIFHQVQVDSTIVEHVKEMAYCNPEDMKHINIIYIPSIHPAEKYGLPRPKDNEMILVCFPKRRLYPEDEVDEVLLAFKRFLMVLCILFFFLWILSK
jgi:hypothetical protein